MCCGLPACGLVHILYCWGPTLSIHLVHETKSSFRKLDLDVILEDGRMKKCFPLWPNIGHCINNWEDSFCMLFFVLASSVNPVLCTDQWSLYSLCCLLLCSLFFKQEMELSLIGLQNAGKTSLVNVVATGGYSEDMIPTVSIILYDAYAPYSCLWDKHSYSSSLLIFEK